MRELNSMTDLAEWLGYEVIDVEGEHVVRQRVNGLGRWVEREARATAAEIKLYDAVRGLALAHVGRHADRAALLQAVHQLKADHYASHDESTRMFYINKGEQTAYRNVLNLLENISLEGS